MTKRTIESFQFTDAAQLRNWLNQFTKQDLSTVYFDIPANDSDTLSFHWQEETLSDGSTVNNIVVS